VVKLGDQVVAETVGEGSGKAWRVKLPVLHAGPVPDITIEAGDMITLTNLLAGDVWVCSGQSNMAQTLKRGPWCPYGGVLNGDAEIAAANYPRIRLFTAGGKEVWAPCTPESAAKFSAAGYFFGRELQRELNVPIGLMQAAIGGTPAEYWTPRAAREAWPGFAAELAAAKLVLQELKPRFDLHRQAAAEWPKAVAEARKKGLPLPERPVASLTREQEELVRAAIHTDTVGQGYAARIKPLTAMTIKGVIWYQGEANTMRADKYRELMSHLISGWRADWGQDSLPFLIMQLVNFGGADGGWAELRAAQQAVVDTVANTGLAVGIDIGDPKNIHPDNKQDVGKRLAMVALKQVYDKDVVASGPRLETAEFAVGRVILNFDPGGRDQHLIFKPESGSGFEVAGADGRFRSVTSVEATGNTLILACPQIAEPRSVRYAWTDNAAATLFNTPGLPAAPFRQTAKAKIDR
jgi:sialate O-acetylesterase